MSDLEINPNAIRGGVPCAKEILCFAAAIARADNKARLQMVKSVNDRDLIKAKINGLRNLSDHIRSGAVTLTPAQNECYTATVDNMAYVEKFEKHYESLHLAMMSTAEKG